MPRPEEGSKVQLNMVQTGLRVSEFQQHTSSQEFMKYPRIKWPEELNFFVVIITGKT